MVRDPAPAPDAPGGAGASVAAPHLLTDGHRLWFPDLAHYVDRYHVEPDLAFVAHARGTAGPCRRSTTSTRTR
ncbi:hypothetical protein [Kitasatospora phosalacinea]|uniref:hypothetical protein n=1 Tax=Kitasatospora phosalacinea TaxID=2065 RepID=UPI00068CFEC1|nr:hypothetical protein [Kitasatospora phosalacinea]